MTGRCLVPASFFSPRTAELGDRGECLASKVQAPFLLSKGGWRRAVSCFAPALANAKATGWCRPLQGSIVDICCSILNLQAKRAKEAAGCSMLECTT